MKSTTRQQLAALLEDPHVLQAVIRNHDVAVDWLPGDSIDDIVASLAENRSLRKALGVAKFAAGALAAVRAVCWPAIASKLRRLSYCEGALTPPGRQTAEERRLETVRRWGFDR